MYGASTWKYVNKGLLIILGVFVLATVASIIFLSNTLLKLDSLIGSSGRSVGSAIELQSLLISLDDAESAVRGYVLTEDRTYLKPYEAALKDIPVNLKAIRSNPDGGLSRSQIGKLQALTNDKLVVMAETVALNASGDNTGARARVATGQGAELMEQIRSTVRTVSTHSLSGIGPRQEQSHDQLRAALWVAGIVSLFVVGICAVLVWYFQYTIYQERALESTKNEFLSLASHQLRTPATNVKQYLGLLMDGYLGDLSQKQLDALGVAYKNNESEIRIMNDLLDVAKLDMQRIQIHKQRVNIVSIVTQVVREYNQYIDARGQTLTLKAPDELMAKVDRAYFKGVIEKLVDNAVKYSHEKTRITVKIRSDEVNNIFEVVIRDRGLGIEKREVPKLFMKFTRLTNEFSANTEGSGMGLYWVKQVMTLHGGTVKVVSREGRGSKFTVRAPIA
jgi:signal transduction histidine kinase